ncbi:hemolysin D [Malaciobacter pacificus]|jgi:RND family efflux transporter MFP subunit|uniref:RND family efflux system, membrane fusion protein n=1 Tax=Malaciobacter pacificus TaxID=1080223 RepID=A0A5C2H8L3_9BACT|nr:efflux RND transporter periplasmic adaptor subunit [Malaciobacter pacificus]QEP33805.1 RND family efflux system, membrane fusion protein [Malaciobacter pacificus]GGD33495.1 hemolysin D [Malaciobacter pacificus]
MKRIGMAIFVVFFMMANFIEAASKAPSLVEVETLKQQEVNDLQEFVGTVNFDKKSKVASQSSGIAKKINFEVGQKVKKGDVLVVIDSDVLNAQINAAKSSVNMYSVQLKNAKKNYDRYKALVEKKSIAQKTFDDAKLEYDVAKESLISAKANLNELNIQKSKKLIKAPFDGIVVEKTVNKDEWLNQGTSIATVVNTSDVEIIFNLPISFINGLEIGQEYDVNISGKSVKAKLFAAIPSGDKLTRTFPVRFKATIKDMFIFDGAQAKVNFAKESKSVALVINRDAVIKRFNMDVVFAVVENQAKMIPVKPLAFFGTNAAISGQGLVEGMQLVTKGNERIFPDMPVKIINK